jgi:hypothetical protein
MKGVLSAFLDAAALGLSGCAAPTPSLKDELVDQGAGRFQYVVTATMLHPLNTSEGEHDRAVRLKRRLAEARLCPSGYRILGRAPPFTPGKTHQGDYAVRDVTYFGECTT